MKEENVSSFEFILHSQKIMLLVQTIFEIILFCLSWSNLHMHFNRHKTKCQLKRIYKHTICKLYKKLKCDNYKIHFIPFTITKIDAIKTMQINLSPCDDQVRLG